VGINLRWRKDRNKPGSLVGAAYDAFKSKVKGIAKELIVDGFEELAEEFGK
jgi:hypothetical protein